MKRLIIVITLIASLFLLFACAQSSTMLGTNDSVQNQSESDQTIISKEEAKQIAFTHANLAENDVVMVTYMLSNLEKPDEPPVYEIDFFYGNTEYEYDIDPVTGGIIAFDYDIPDFEISDYQAAIGMA